MFTSVRLMRRASLKCLMALAGAAAMAPTGVAAQDCKLSVQASPQVLFSGQSAQVNVFAHFPSPPAPNGAYAFASSNFDVSASDPAWISASAGAILGNDVLGINASQAHAPQLGAFANPSNPIRVWHGRFAPQSAAPSVIEITADPTDFSVYPSKLTSSSAPCDADGGSNYILVNPLRMGRWLAAPGPGTAIEIQDDVIVDGDIITGENCNATSIGGATIKVYICPSDPRASRGTGVPSGSVQFFDSSNRVVFDHMPDSFTATVHIPGAGDDVFQWDPGDGVDADPPQRSRVSSMTVSFSGLENGGYAAGAIFAMSDGSVRPVRYSGYMGGVYVASGDLNDENDGNLPDLVVSALPQTFEAHSSRGALQSLSGNNTWTLRYDQPVVVIVRGANGQPQALTVDRIDVQGIRETAAQMRSSNNLKQLSLGCHVFTAKGVQQMTVTPQQ